MVGFLLENQELRLDSEPRVAAFSHPENRWKLQDVFGTQMPQTLWRLGSGCTTLVPVLSLTAGSRAVPDPPAPRFLENRVSAMLILARF